MFNPDWMHFGSTYLNESRISAMKILKSWYRSVLKDKHLNDYMKITMAKYIPSLW
jgi:hypothetical protein